MTNVERHPIPRVVTIDMGQLAAAIEDRRTADKVTLDVVADWIGITAPTFTRIKRAGNAEQADGESAEDYRRRRRYRPDTEAYLSICAWLRADPRDFTDGGVSRVIGADE